MTFTTLTFLLFLGLVLGVYRALPNRRTQNVLLILSSYAFYSWWDWRFSVLMLVSSLVDFLVGKRLAQVDGTRSRKWLLAASLGANLGLLGTFKYFNFFAAELTDLAASLGLNLHPVTLRLVLPVGISFYTFQTLSYTIDIYRRQLEPSKSLLDYLAFVSFFPQLVAGPIERAAHLLPQFQQPRQVRESDLVDGLRQILWGFVKKLVLADNLARIVDLHYANPGESSGPVLMLATVCFGFQIYLDFSGYSDIATGTARLFGFRLMRNFANPYFSMSAAEFWRRWHISLSTWFRDYVYIPLGGNRASRARQAFNLLATFTLSGLWHGASWNFVIWGALNGLWIVPSVMTGRRASEGPDDLPGGTARLPQPRALSRMLGTFAFVTLTWVFFRADTLGDSLLIFERAGLDLLTPSAYLEAWQVIGGELGLFALLGLFVLAEWFQRGKQHGLDLPWPRAARWAVYSGLIWLCMYRMPNDVPTFIYFQF